MSLSRRHTLAGLAALGLLPSTVTAATQNKVAELAAKIQPKVVAWRRDIHQNPELGNREFRTSKLVATELKRLGLEVTENIAHTGVKGVLKGAKTGPVVALRADMDALPVPDKSGVEFASTATADYNGQTVSVTHACGHDSHVAMLLGAAEVLCAMKSEIAGTVVFIFQPSEEGPPKGEEGGAELMVKEGVLENPHVSAIFGVHVWPGKTGLIAYRQKGFMAHADQFEIRLKGKQTHGAQPWNGVDMSALAATIIENTNQITARQVDVTKEPTVLTIAAVQGGLRWNIIPEEYVMLGTLRTFSEERRTDIVNRFTQMVNHMAAAYGATAEITFVTRAELTYNDPSLTEYLYPTMLEAAGTKDLVVPDTLPVTGGEDFSAYQKLVPGTFVFLGVSAPGVDPKTDAPNHSPYFKIYEPALETGVRAHALAALAMLKRKA